MPYHPFFVIVKPIRDSVKCGDRCPFIIPYNRHMPKTYSKTTYKQAKISKAVLQRPVLPVNVAVSGNDMESMVQ